MEVQRKIYFCKVEFLKNGSIVHPDRIFQYIDQLPYNSSGKYLPLKNGNERCLYVDESSIPIAARIGTRRKNDLPVVENAGTTRPVPLQNGEALLECTHFIIFQNNVMGIEYNQFAPRTGGLAGYLKEKASKLVDEVDVKYLMKKDLWEDLRKAKNGEILAFNLRVQKGAEDTFKDLSGNLKESFKKLVEAMPGSETIEIVVRAAKRSKRGFTLPFLDMIPSWISRPEVSSMVESAKLKIINPDEEREEIDLLNKYIMSTKKVIKQREDLKSVDSHDMFAKIREAYSELEQQIKDSIWMQ